MCGKKPDVDLKVDIDSIVSEIVEYPQIAIYDEVTKSYGVSLPDTNPNLKTTDNQTNGEQK